MQDVSPYPSEAARELMKQNWEQTSVTSDNGTIGMFGTNEKYYFFMKYEAESSELWYQGSTQEKDYILLFQMGDTQSEWTGVQYNIDSDLSTTAGYELSPLSVTNDVKTRGRDQILTDGRNNSDFSGYFNFDSNDNSIEIQVIRETLKDEQTTDDNSIIRIERGRSLSGTHFTASGTAVNFEVTLASAVSLAA